MNLSDLRDLIITANEAYRKGHPIISDSKFDTLMDELQLLDPEDELLNKVGFEIKDESRKRRLPIEMASMNKLKTYDDIKAWTRSKNLGYRESIVITPKFDGLSLCVDELNGMAWTRGDGIYGQECDRHYTEIQNKLSSVPERFSPRSLFTFGELMIPKKVFLEKYANDFANPRNQVGGILNSKELTESLKDCQYIKYGVSSDYPFQTKHEILCFLNKHQEEQVPHCLCTFGDLSTEFLIRLFNKWSDKYEIDGLIIEINNINIQKNLGREPSNNNPAWARAFKHESFEQTSETEVTGITWNISKQGFMKPILQVNPIKLDGVTVSNVTGNNARFVQDLRLGKGALIKIKRSGMVIPKIVDVIEPSFELLPTKCSCCGTELLWNENGVELVCDNIECEGQKLKRIISFFEILGVDQVSEGVLTQIYDAGYTTIKEILNLNVSDLEKIDGFGSRKSKIVHTNIHSKMKDVSLSKLQHATGIFKGLGSKKLLLLEGFLSKPSVSDIVKIEGFALTSATSYIEGYDKFTEFVKDLPITVKKKVKISDGDFSGQSFVFTGFRDKEVEEKIEQKGGKISNSISKNTTYLIIKSLGSGSSKEKKALDLGVKVLTIDDLIKMIKMV